MIKENNIVKEERVMKIPTDLGNIVVTLVNDDTHPEVIVDFESSLINDNSAYFKQDGDKTLQLTRVVLNLDEKKFNTYIWEDVMDEDGMEFSHKHVFQEYEILENGTEITFKGDRAYIMGHDDGEFDESHDRLNYHIGFAKDGETYQDVENRLDSKGTWYDTMITWQSAKVISK